MDPKRHSFAKRRFWSIHCEKIGTGRLSWTGMEEPPRKN